MIPYDIEKSFQFFETCFYY